MRVSELKQQARNTERISVFLDGKYSFSLGVNDLLELKLKVGDEISETELKRLKKVSEDSLLTQKAIEKCLRRPHSVKEISDYLKRNRAEEELIETILEKCAKMRLLNDEEFAKTWLRHRQNGNRSRRHIINELRQKGISSDIINELEFGDESSTLRDLVAKKRSKYSDERKLINYLQRKGFAYSDIAAVLKDVED